MGNFMRYDFCPYRRDFENCTKVIQNRTGGARGRKERVKRGSLLAKGKRGVDRGATAES